MSQAVEVPPSAPASVAVAEAPLGSGSTLRDLTSGSSGLLVLLVLVFICYARASQGGYVWDDDAYVSANTTLRSFAGLSRIWTEPGATPQYYPMTFTSFWLEVQAFGLNPKVSHVINFALHAGSVLLLWRILLRLAVPGAFVAAAVFAVHPIQVESVAWISERKNTLSLALALSSLWCYLRYARLGVISVLPAGEGLSVPLPDDPKRLYRLFLALFTLALLAKTTVSVLPGVILIVVWWQRGRITKADFVPLLPAFALGLIGGLITSYLEHSPYYVGASGPDWAVGPVARLMLVGQTAAFYAWKILWPFPLGLTHDAKGNTVPLWPYAASFNYYRWAIDTRNVLQWLPLAGLVATITAFWALRRRIGRGPLACVLLFLAGLLPACGLFTYYPQRFAWVADHLAYVGSIGLIVGVVAALAGPLGRRPQVGASVAGLFLVGFAGMTVWEVNSFTSLKTLWERTIQQNPRSWLASVNYGTWLMDTANDQYVQDVSNGVDNPAAKRDELRQKAEVWIQHGMKINPGAVEALTSLGTLQRQRGDLPGAIAYYRQAVDMADRRDANGYQLPKFLLGDTLSQSGDAAGALAVFDQLAPMEPMLKTRNPNLFSRMHTVYGNQLMRRLKSPVAPEMPEADRATLNDAMDQFVQATVVAPDFVPPKLQLASILSDIGNTDEALQQLTDALRLDKNNLEAKMLTAKIAAKQGQYNVALAQLQNLLQTDARYLPAHMELAQLYQRTGRPAEAIKELQNTLGVLPDATPAKQMLAELQATATQPGNAPATQAAPATRPF